MDPSYIYALCPAIMWHLNTGFIGAGILDKQRLIRTGRDLIFAVKMANAELLLYFAEEE